MDLPREESDGIKSVGIFVCTSNAFKNEHGQYFGFQHICWVANYIKTKYENTKKPHDAAQPQDNLAIKHNLIRNKILKSFIK